MANFYGKARSNFVAFDETKIAAIQTLFPVQFHPGDDDTFCIVSEDEGGTPHCYCDPHDLDTAQAATLLGLNWEEVADGYLEFLDVVHLAFAEDPLSLFVWMEIGSEGNRYLHGAATAIDVTGEVINQIVLDDIYQTPDVNTRAAY